MMTQAHKFFIDKVKLGKKGQITIPKDIRDEDGLEEDDVFTLTHTPAGDIILRKKRVEKPEELLFEFLEKLPPFDWRKAWAEVKKERAMEHR